MNWRELFDQTLSVKIKVGDRVKHRATGRLGAVNQTAVVDGLATISVRYDLGGETMLVPSEEYMKLEKKR
jgi:hypothetical protein